MSGTWWVCVAGLAVVAVLATPARAAEYYVSPGGNDASAGTSAQEAFKTIAKAAELVEAGDTINIAPGKYVERIKVTRSGTSDAPITLRKRGDGEVVLTTPLPDIAPFYEKYALSLQGQEHIVVEGITFKDCNGWILMWDSNHCTVQNCVFDGARTYNCLRINSGTYNRILRCTFKKAQPRTGFREEASWIPVPGADYIEIFRDSHHNLVQDCEFGQITHTAVSISAVEDQYTPSRNITRNCVFTDPYWKCFWLHKGAHNLVENSVSTGESAAFVQLEGGTSIIRRNLFTHYRDSTNANPDETLRGAIRMQYDASRHNRIYNNLFYGNERTLTNNSYRGRIFDNIFKNNIFHNNGQTILLGFPDYRNTNRNYFYNNVMRGTAPGQKVIQLERDHYTLKEAQTQLPDLYKGNIEADPLFEGEDRDDFRLKKDSPCVDSGAALTFAAEAGQGAEIVVDDALYFCDGFGLIEGDDVIVGSNEPARLVKVDYERRLLVLDRRISWKKGDPVNLAYEGAGPDMGPYEFGASAVRIGRLSGE